MKPETETKEPTMKTQEQSFDHILDEILDGFYGERTTPTRDILRLAAADAARRLNPEIAQAAIHKVVRHAEATRTSNMAFYDIEKRNEWKAKLEKKQKQGTRV